jgi:protein-S-isoprenylcysteine O-methyltransferase Ste14
MSITLSHLLILALTWLIYFVLHSLLASLRVKRWLQEHRPALIPPYRLIYNLLALALLMPPLGLTLAWRGPPLWQWTGIWAVLADLAALTAIAGFLWTLRCYDSQAFLGLRQWRQGEKSIEDQERFQISPLHRYVRHPWYSLGLVVLWTRDMDPAFLVAVIAITFYCIIGSRLEERKLLVYHGEVYRRYRERVPALLPLPGVIKSVR